MRAVMIIGSPYGHLYGGRLFGRPQKCTRNAVDPPCARFGCIASAHPHPRYVSKRYRPHERSGLVRTACLVALILINAPRYVFASAWPQVKGDIFVIQLTEFYEVVTSGSAVTPASSFEQLATGLYIEYGLGRNWTIGAEGIYFQQADARESAVPGDPAEQSTTEGFGNREIFIQRSFTPDLPARFSFADPLQMAVKASLFFPSELTEIDIVSGNSEINRDGGAEITFLLGHTFNGRRKSYFAGEFGYRYHDGRDPDFLEIDLVYGRALTKNIEWSVKSYNSISLQNGNNGGTDFDFYRLEGAALFKFPFGFFEIGVIEDIGGRNLNLGQSYFIKIWERF